MTCNDADLLLDDFVDGCLAAADQERVLAHLGECAACRRLADGLRGVVDAAAELPDRIAPERDLWPGIVDGINRGLPRSGVGSPRRWRAWGAILAVAAAIAAITAVVTVRMTASRPQPAAVGGSAVAASLDLARAQATFAAARRQLLAAVEARRGSLSPRTAAVVERNLQIIDGAVREMEAALAREPADPALPALLLTAYQQEIDLLQRTATLPAAS
ncbi:MAG TPA: zf-HC2 domain-containing protein [Thermoanaerobaculaceae bacterium]|nr:zf-HC2 domain-containing protein [Thermoanaerobaculaceae bacterium]